MEEAEGANRAAVECCHSLLNQLSLPQEKVKYGNIVAESGEAVSKLLFHAQYTIILAFAAFNMVFSEVELSWNVLINPHDLYAERLKLQTSIILHILEDFSNRKASKEYGYFVAVTTLEEVGDGKVRELTGDVVFPVVFKCITFKPQKGEVLVGTVDKVLRHGIVLKSGPLEGIFLSAQVMRDYGYVAGENPMFLSEKHPKLEKGCMVRFKVLGFKWMEIDREFQVLATIAGDFLGPI